MWRGARPGGHVSAWHADRVRGQGERLDRVRACGQLTPYEWVDKETGARFPHRARCGVWRLCRSCARARRRKLQGGVAAQRALALAVYRDRVRKHYAGREGRWGERLVTFTVPHSGDLAADVELLPRLWRAIEAPWRRHLRARGLRETQVYVRSIEVAHAGHAHLHVWMLGPYIERALLAVWWTEACAREGREVLARSVADVVREARDPRTREWLQRHVQGESVPWLVVDVRGGSGGAAAAYAAKVGVALYTVKGTEVQELAPVHAARVYEALEGVRVTQWARGWAPRKGRSDRWHMRRISLVSPTGRPLFFVSEVYGHATHCDGLLSSDHTGYGGTSEGTGPPSVGPPEKGT